MATVKVPINQIFEEISIDTFDFPKYTTQIINLANQNSHGTRPNVVGQMSDLINEPEEKTYEEWKKYYLENYGDRIDAAVAKIWPMIQKMKEAIEKIDEKMVRNWVTDLVINKTAEGLIIQEFILKYLSKKLDKKYRLATPDEESKGIDGFIGDKAVSIKSITYKSKVSTKQEKIDVPIIYYNKTKDYLNIEYDESYIK